MVIQAWAYILLQKWDIRLKIICIKCQGMVYRSSWVKIAWFLLDEWSCIKQYWVVYYYQNKQKHYKRGHLPLINQSFHAIVSSLMSIFPNCSFKARCSKILLSSKNTKEANHVTYKNKKEQSNTNLLYFSFDSPLAMGKQTVWTDCQSEYTGIGQTGFWVNWRQLHPLCHIPLTLSHLREKSGIALQKFYTVVCVIDFFSQLAMTSGRH